MNFNYTASGGLSIAGYSPTTGPGGNTRIEIVSGYQFNRLLNKLRNPYVDAHDSLQRLRRLKRISK